MDKTYFQNVLYPFQDRFLGLLKTVETGFYLGGGTAASRAYLNHRYSEDLDFFVNDDEAFPLWTDRVIHAAAGRPGWEVQILLREPRFGRMLLKEGDAALKIELINDVPSRVGETLNHPVLGKVDSAENILSNKVTALLDRREPRDFADIWAFCTRMKLSLGRSLEDAKSKAAGIFPADLARVLWSVSEGDWEAVRWIEDPGHRIEDPGYRTEDPGYRTKDPGLRTEKPTADRFISDLRRLGESLVVVPRSLREAE